MNECRRCGGEIPLSRHGNSPYCSDKCAYEVKKEASKRRYEFLKDLEGLFWEQHALLEKFYDLQKLGHTIRYEQLKEKAFNFGFSLGETLLPTGEIGKVVGDYFYYLNPKTKVVTIWKLRSDPSQTV